jgi:hypothetical protein
LLPARQPEIGKEKEEDNPASTFQLELTASVITKKIEKNAGLALPKRSGMTTRSIS